MISRSSRFCSKIGEIILAQVKEKIDSGKDIVLLNVREPGEFERGHIQEATDLPWTRGVLKEKYTFLFQKTNLLLSAKAEPEVVWQALSRMLGNIKS